MFENLRRKIGEAIEKIEDGFKNVITLGKHEKIKEHARQYENTLLLLAELHSKQEQLVVDLKTEIVDLEEKRSMAAKACKRCQTDLTADITEINLSFPEVKPPPVNKEAIHLDGIQDYRIEKEFKDNKVGAASKNFMMYIARNKGAQQQVMKHPVAIAGVALIDGINALASATKAASAQLEEIVAMESKANFYAKEYRDGNWKLTRLINEIGEDKKLLIDHVDHLDTAKEQLIAFHNKIRNSPSKGRKIIRWWRKLLQVNIYNRREIKKLESARDVVYGIITNIDLILKKSYA
jgi:hypothetical protein